ncbi:MAG TPA: D-alanyl-D-alanine carboxypeptidase family protein [Rhizobiaceae bacterium]|jgi:D-alanyl-D-alanine carboxypeptidase (penicillin-binding protein 5/6)|nr:D-alanyl-D-alanine carboxypeptidase family protein [Rhizobiaceae bacterium]
MTTLTRILAFVALVLFAAAPLTQARAELFETKAKEAFLIDAETGTILFSKNADKLIPPASLAKLMTLEMVFHAIKAGRLTLADKFYISVNAWKKGGAGSGGSTMFAAVKSSVSLEDLIKGMAVVSANDACIAVAEGMAGTEDNFAQLMTERARKIGLEKSVFKNATGLPQEGEVATVRELAMLGLHIWQDYPEFYHYFSLPDFKWNRIDQRNRNPLLTMDIGADGMKTGFTDDSGYAIVGSAARDGRRLFLAMSGLSSAAERAEEARKMLEWGMNAFRKSKLFGSDEVVGEAAVFGGAKSAVPLKSKGPISIFVPLTNRDQLIAKVVYEGPLVAPVEEGARVGTLRVFIGDTLSQETPLYAAESIGVGTLYQRATGALEELAVGWLR